jgi:hypothetical protein
MVVLLIALAALIVLVATSGGVAPWQLGVGLNVDSDWIILEGYYSAGDRGTSARKEAWVGGTTSRGAADIHSIRLGAVPNLVGNLRRGLVTMRAVGIAAHAVVRHFMGVVSTYGKAKAQDTGERDADRR